MDSSSLTVPALKTIIAPLNNMPMFYFKYRTMYKVHVHAAGANRKLLYDCAYVREINPLD